MIGIGVIGYGYWGPNLLRNFADCPDTRLVALSDLRPERLEAARQRYPGLLATANHGELIAHPGVDAVAIATPVSTHYPLALEALRAGKHVMVEKPLAASASECDRLIEEASRRQRVLMVDHTFIYTGAVGKIRELIAGEALGELLYYDSVRVNLGLFQHDVNVIWDLAVHDLAIMDSVLPFRPRAVSATGMSHVVGQPENIAYLTLFFDSRFIAHLHVNWLAPVKVRRTLIGGSRQMIVYDDLEPSEKIKVYDKGITLADNGESVYRLLIGYRMGDMWAPRLDISEALQGGVRDLARCIRDGDTPRGDGASGRRVVEILEAATRSVAERGRLVELSQQGVKA